MRTLLAALILVCAGAAAQPVRLDAGAAAAPAPPPDWRGTLAFAIENDRFAGGNGDRNYTNGFQLSWRSPTAQLPAPLAWVDQRLDRWLGEGDVRWGLALGQTLYTPQDTTRRVPDPTDRPYAANLFLAASLSRASATALTVLEFQAGIVGPGALGAEVQNTVHRAFNIPLVEGWGRQLRNEGVFNLVAERKWRIPLGRIGALETEAMPSATISLGNGNIYGALGGMLRLGQGLGADFGPARIRPALAGSAFFQPEAGGREWGWYVFAGVEGRAVGRDISLDGNTWRSGPRVDRRPLVGDAQAGASVYWRDVRASFTYIVRSEEFHGQRDGLQQFGSLSLAVRF